MASGVLGAVLLLVGSVLPWTRVVAADEVVVRSGLSQSGAVLVILGLVLFAVVLVSHDLLRHATTSLLTGGVAAAVVGEAWFRIGQNAIADPFIDVQSVHPGLGLVLVSLGAFTVLAYGLLAARAVRGYGADTGDRSPDFPFRKTR